MHPLEPTPVSHIRMVDSANLMFGGVHHHFPQGQVLNIGRDINSYEASILIKSSKAAMVTGGHVYMTPDAFAKIMNQAGV